MPKRSELDERKAAILHAIVAQYVRTGEPVGSKTIVEHFPLKVSSATVRNEMSALEGSGYIFQPHTSAGRVPTDTGYRYYVDRFAGEGKLPATHERRIRSFFGEPHWELEEALRKTAALLSELTDHAAVVFAPALDRSVVRHVELVNIGHERVMVVLVTDTGRVENHVVRVPENVEVHLDQAVEMLNRIVSGELLENACQALRASIERFPLEMRELAERVAVILEEEVVEERDRVFLDGTSTMVDEQKFQDLETVRQVIEALEHRRVLFELVADALAVQRVSVRIGSENLIEEMQSCSVIATSYGPGGSALGSLGVVGPTRMDYSHTIATVHEVASYLGRMLTEPSL
jgi:heat-inducible transcriptional repressor